MDEIDIASYIREKLYQQKIGGIKPMWLMIPMNLVGFGLILSVVLIQNNNFILEGIIISWFTLLLFTYLYIRLIEGSRNISIFLYFIDVVLVVLLDLWFYNSNRSTLQHINLYLLIAMIPAFYLNGRYIGGKVSGIKFDGIVKDVYGLFTLKVNYISYLSAKPSARQWIFFFGGIGTVIISLLFSLFALIAYSYPWFFIIPIFLFIGEMWDYSRKPGSPFAGELNHFKRERLIIRDWKGSLIK